MRAIKGTILIFWAFLELLVRWIDCNPGKFPTVTIFKIWTHIIYGTFINQLSLFSSRLVHHVYFFKYISEIFPRTPINRFLELHLGNISHIHMMNQYKITFRYFAYLSGMAFIAWVTFSTLFWKIREAISMICNNIWLQSNLPSWSVSFPLMSLERS